MMEIPTGLTELVHPWAALYADNKGVSDTVTFLHLGGLLLGGGAAISMDRETLGAHRLDDHTRGHLLERLRGVHVWVLLGLGLTFVTGLLQVASDLKTFLPSGVFWIKMALVAVLLANGGLVIRGEKAAAQGQWGPLRFAAVASLVLWTLILLLGVILTTVG
jgi:hypothetical protein